MWGRYRLHEIAVCVFCFFQAEDGIRDVAVTGVQTCALPICDDPPARRPHESRTSTHTVLPFRDRKSTRLNSSHGYISYAVFCLKKKEPRLATHSCLQGRARAAGACARSHWC